MLVPDHNCKICKGTGMREHEDMSFMIPCICFVEKSDAPDELVRLIINVLGGEEIEYESNSKPVKGKTKF